MKKNNEIDEEAIDYEVKVSDLLNKSNNRAWLITFVSILSFFIMFFLYIYKPLIKTVPYVIKINGDGIPNLVTSLNEKNIEVEEAVDKYFIKEYIIRREQYLWNLLEKDYLFVQLLTSTKIVQDFKTKYQGEEALDKVLGEDGKISVKIKSITLGKNAGLKNATVRIEKTIKKREDKPIIANRVITLVFKYNTNLKLDEKNRLENPLGFTVLTYKVEKEML